MMTRSYDFNFVYEINLENDDCVTFIELMNGCLSSRTR